MDQTNMIYPLFAMAALPGIVLLLLFYFRLNAVLEGKVGSHYLEVQGAEAAPPIIVKLTHNLANLFEFPVLFHAAGILSIVTHTVDETQIVLAWFYVGFRYVHSAIHITYNKVIHRSSVHFVSDIILIFLWFRVVLLQDAM